MINWGIIGCGDVTEVKSGPAFNKVENSRLVAVMRRDAVKAKDYAVRHGVPKWYSDANQLINDPEVTAVYVATPPDSHARYTVAALEADKPVYVEKPMALNAAECKQMLDKSLATKIKLSVAHYRRAQPMFRKIKELIDEKIIGDIRFVQLKFLKPALTESELEIPKTKWRVDPSKAGGGLFHDLAPHQLDLMIFFFGDIQSSCGNSYNQERKYNADDVVAGTILFENGILFNGLWCFTVNESEAEDQVEIVGSTGRIKFGVFDHFEITVERNGERQIIPFDKIPHVQQPMIEKVVEYFSGGKTNPCPPEAGLRVMQVIHNFAAPQL